MPAAAAQTALLPEQFLQMTKPKHSKQVSAQPYVDGGTTNTALQQAGLGHCIYLNVNASITIAGTVTGGTWAASPYPMPFALIKQLRFGSNNSFLMRQLSGWGMYKWLRNRYGIDCLDGRSSNFSANSKANLGQSGTRPVPGGNLAAGTFNCSFAMPIPLSYNEAAETALIVLQSNNTVFNLGLDWASITGGIGATGGSNDVLSGLTGTGLTVTTAITYTVGLDWFEVVPGNLSRLVGYFMSVNETSQPLVAGTNIVKPPTNDYYTTVHLEVVNAGAPVAVANLSNLVFKHSGNVIDFVEDYNVNLSRNFWRHGGLAPVDGTAVFDLGIRRGLLQRRDTLDAFNDQNITNLEVDFDIPGSLSITGTNGVFQIYEALRGITQGQA